MTEPLLKISKLNKAFGQVVIARDIDLNIGADEGLGIIGPNGAGKSTLFNLITGDLSPNSGQIEFNGAEMTGLKPHDRCRRGIGRSYQIPQPFAKMTVFENVMTAGVFGAGRREKDATRHAVETLSLTGLITHANKLAGQLTLLQRKRLELARALSTEPRLLLLDEIAGGLTEGEVKSLIGTIRNIRGRGISIIWIEHIVHALIATVDRLVVLNGGSFLADGDPQTVMTSPEVQRIYMGVEPA